MLINSITYIKKKYPELEISQHKNYIIFEGRFIIAAKHDDQEIKIAPRLKIIYPNNYPNQFPLVFDVMNSYPSEHRLSNGGLCVGTYFDMLLKLNKSSSIEDYIQHFLIPYFISIFLFNETGEYVFGEREHGMEGIYSSIAEYFNINSDYDKEIIHKILEWAAKITKLRRMKSINVQYFQKEYSNKVGLLRKAGILSLKKHYRYLLEAEKSNKKISQNQ